ncbi:MAG: magnesium/cobalt transporter CorA [Alphaproteobacteria bacterium]
MDIDGQPIEARTASLVIGGRTPKPGEAPGQLRPPPGAQPTHVTAVAFGPDAVTPEGDAAWTHGPAPLPDAHHRWINVTGLENVDQLSQLLTPLGLSPLALEDILSIHQRPRADEFDDAVLLFLPMLRRDPQSHITLSEQVAIYCTGNHVVTVQERDGDVFDPIRKRMKNPKARMRKGGAPYLAYALLDAIIDGYFPVMEALGEAVEHAEQQVMDEERAIPLHEIHTIKREVTGLRRLIWPMRDMVYQLLKSAQDGAGAFADIDLAHLQDCRDHLLQLIDQADSVIETCNDVRDMIIAQSGMKLNEVMGMLTVIATIFMPLGFLAGIWGMNFDASSPYNMPELGLRYGYPMALGLMAALGIGLVLWFKKKGWL